MFLGKDGAVVTVGLHTEILSPGISSPVFVVDTLVTGTGVPDALVTDRVVGDTVAGGNTTKDPVEARAEAGTVVEVGTIVVAGTGV